VEQNKTKNQQRASAAKACESCSRTMWINFCALHQWNLQLPLLLWLYAGNNVEKGADVC